MEREELTYPEKLSVRWKRWREKQKEGQDRDNNRGRNRKAQGMHDKMEAQTKTPGFAKEKETTRKKEGNRRLIRTCRAGSNWYFRIAAECGVESEARLSKRIP